MANKPVTLAEGDGHDRLALSEENQHKDLQSLYTASEQRGDAVDGHLSLQSSVSDDSCAKEVSVGFIKSERIAEGNGHTLLAMSEENQQKDLQSLCIISEVREHTMDGHSFLWSSVSDDTCIEEVSVGVMPAFTTGDLSLKNKQEDDNVEFLTEDQAAKAQKSEDNTLSDNLAVDYTSSKGTSADKMILQRDGTEDNGLSCELVQGDNSGEFGCTENARNQEEPLVEQSILAVENCTSVMINDEKAEYQRVCILNNENSRTHFQAQLVKENDGCLSNDLPVEIHDCHSDVEKLEEDEHNEAGAGESMPSFTEEAPKELQSVDKAASSITLGLNNLHEDTGCDRVRSHIGDSGTLIVSAYPEGIECHNVTLMATSETAFSAPQESFSVPYKEMEKEDCAQNFDGTFSTTGDDSQVAKPCLGPYTAENVVECSDSTVQDELKSIAEAGKVTEIMTRDDSDAVSKCNSECRKLMPSEAHDDSRIGIGTVELSEVFAQVCIAEAGASYADEDCASPAKKMGLSPSSPVLSTISEMGVMNENTENSQKMRVMIEDTRNAHFAVKNTHGEVNTEDKPLSQTEEGAASSEYQHYGHTADLDGGSSLDSTAGTGQQQSGGHTPAEDEEASSTGGEDTASSPAYIRPVMQQRKKINIHHQFVREIVKIQHDREQYDREQAERQIQAQHAAASLPQAAYKTSDIKEHQKSSSLKGRDVKGEADKQKGVKDLGAHRQVKDIQQKQSQRNKKPSPIQSMNGSSHQWSPRKESNEQSQQPLTFLQAMVPKETVKTGHGKQQRSISIYRPPVVRESFAAEQRNTTEPETSYHQSGAYAINSSPDSSASSFSDSRFPVTGSSHVIEEGPLKVGRSNSGECYGDNIECQADFTSTGMGIKVTFDTERRQRHIQFSEGQDSLSRHEQASPAASHSSSGFKVRRNSNFSSSFQDSRPSSASRQADLVEIPFKGSDLPFRQATTSGLLQSKSSTESAHHSGRAGKSSDKRTEKKSSFFEQADNSANLQSTSSRSHKPPSPIIRHGSDDRSGQSVSNDSSRHSDWYPGVPSPSSQGFSTPSFTRSASLGSSHGGDVFGSTFVATANVRNEEPNRTARSMQANLQHQQFDTPRSHDYRGNQTYAMSTGNSRGKKELQYKNTAKEYGSPFQAMSKDMSRPQAVFPSPAQRSADANPDSKGFGMNWHAKNLTQTHSREFSQESLRRSQSDGPRKGYTQNLQAQPTPLPSREILFSTMPMQEKWGDIVDDLTDSYEYLQVKSQGERERHTGTLLYGGSNQTAAGYTDGKPSKPVFRDSKQDRGIPKYSYKETDSLQKQTNFMREHSAYETPIRKSVFDRLGPQSNFQESILGPPPKILDSRGLLKASPDVLMTNGPPVSTYTSFDGGYYGPPQWVPQVTSLPHDIASSSTDEGREVVVQAYTEPKQRRSKRELYVPRRGS